MPTKDNNNYYKKLKKYWQLALNAYTDANQFFGGIQTVRDIRKEIANSSELNPVEKEELDKSAHQLINMMRLSINFLNNNISLSDRLAVSLMEKEYNSGEYDKSLSEKNKKALLNRINSFKNLTNSEKKYTDYYYEFMGLMTKALNQDVSSQDYQALLDKADELVSEINISSQLAPKEKNTLRDMDSAFSDITMTLNDIAKNNLTDNIIETMKYTIQAYLEGAYTRYFGKDNEQALADKIALFEETIKNYQEKGKNEVVEEPTPEVTVNTVPQEAAPPPVEEKPVEPIPVVEQTKEAQPTPDEKTFDQQKAQELYNKLKGDIQNLWFKLLSGDFNTMSYNELATEMESIRQEGKANMAKLNEINKKELAANILAIFHMMRSSFDVRNNNFNQAPQSFRFLRTFEKDPVYEQYLDPTLQTKYRQRLEHMLEIINNSKDVIEDNNYNNIINEVLKTWHNLIKAESIYDYERIGRQIRSLSDALFGSKLNNAHRKEIENSLLALRDINEVGYYLANDQLRLEELDTMARKIERAVQQAFLSSSLNARQKDYIRDKAMMLRREINKKIDFIQSIDQIGSGFHF